MKKPDFMWELLLADGSIVTGEGNEKALKIALKTPDLVDGDVWWNGCRNNIEHWMFLIK